MGKRERHETILDLVRERRIPSQETLREFLAEVGIDVTQATLSRDLRELRLLKVTDSEGRSHYALPPDSWEQTPPLERLLPALYVSVDGAGNLVVLKTLTGGAQPVAVALDWEEWPEVLGTIAGDDTILVILRDAADSPSIQDRIRRLAGSAE